MYRNPCAWHDSSQVDLNSEENKIQLKCQNSFGSNGASVTSIAAALFAISCSSVSQKHSYHRHLVTILPVSLGNNHVNVNPNNHVSITWEQSCLVSCGNNL